MSGFFDYLRESKLREKKINFTPFDDLSPSDHMFNLALKSPMTVVRKGLLLKSHPNLFQSLSESHENHPEID